MDVTELNFCDIKGTRTQPRASIQLTSDGVAGDRRFGFVDSGTGAILKTVQHPALSLAEANCVGDVLRLTLPDGSSHEQSVRSTGSSLRVGYWGRTLRAVPIPGVISEAVSSFVGRPVMLVESGQPAGFVYGEAVSIWFSTALAELSQRVGAELDQRRFRLTIGIDDADAPVDESRLVGCRLSFGDALVEVTEQVNRCKIIDWNPETAEADQRVLATLAGYRRAGSSIPFGVAGRVINPGTIRRGAAAYFVG